jgi:hypothetical protein
LRLRVPSVTEAVLSITPRSFNGFGEEPAGETLNTD